MQPDAVGSAFSLQFSCYLGPFLCGPEKAPGERLFLRLNSRPPPRTRGVCDSLGHRHRPIDAYTVCVGESSSARRRAPGLYKIFVLFDAFVQESILLSASTPLVWAPHSIPSLPTLLRNIVVPPDHPELQYLPYNIGNRNIV